MLSNKKIINLINKNKWDDILENLKRNKIKKNDNILNGKNIIHIATLNNRKEIIDYILKIDHEILSKIDNDGNSCIHIMILNGYIDILKKSLKKNNSFINLVNDKEETIGYLCSQDGNLFNWIIRNIDSVDYNSTSLDGITPFLKQIYLSKKENDIYYKNIDEILKKGIPLDIPMSEPPLCLSSRLGKTYIVDRLLKIKDINIDIYNEKYETPFIISINSMNYNISKKLIKEGADINYIGGMGEFNTFILCALRRDYKMVDFFLENNFNFNKQNKFLDTSLHRVLLYDNFSLEYLYKIISRSDLNIPNIDGITPLHLILEKKNWENFSHILKTKDMNIFLKNSDNQTPTYNLKESISTFYDILTDSYLRKIDKKMAKEICVNNDINNIKCKNLIKRKILKESKSIPDINNRDLIKNIKFINEKYKNTVRFNSDTLHNVIYTICILKTYNNVMVPYQYKYVDKLSNDLDMIQDNSLYKTPVGNVITDLVYAYHTILYEISPYIIIWRSIDKYYIHPDLELSIKKCLQRDKIRFIFMRITIIPVFNNAPSGHANILIFDKKTGILDRFEPHGNIPFLEIEKLDSLLYNKIGGMLKDYLHNKSLKLIYIKPSDYKNKIGVQTISNDFELYVKKLGDPEGFCLSWIYWYLETRLKNPDINPIELIEETYKKIIDTNLNRNKKLNDKNKGDFTFINYIRNYASTLDNIKNKLLQKSGIISHNYYNLIMRPRDRKKLLINIQSIINKKM
jgi:ankyrin repeat protein